MSSVDKKKRTKCGKKRTLTDKAAIGAICLSSDLLYELLEGRGDAIGLRVRERFWRPDDKAILSKRRMDLQQKGSGAGVGLPIPVLRNKHVGVMQRMQRTRLHGGFFMG